MLDIEDLKGLIGQLNLGLVIAEGTKDDLVHLPVEDVKGIVRWLTSYLCDLNEE